ncbi:MAG TPA: hypothetical protein VGY54_06535, partial [Polyangiaceae bacterium]|nr:hypothetical protein [Polyangiaceae bacterium]
VLAAGPFRKCCRRVDEERVGGRRGDATLINCRRSSRSSRWVRGVAATAPDFDEDARADFEAFVRFVVLVFVFLTLFFCSLVDVVYGTGRPREPEELDRRHTGARTAEDR